MTQSQYRLYWREWQACRAWLIAHGRDPKQADAQRGKLTAEALGYELSMTNWPRWKNLELDKVLAKFRSVYDGGNLHAQMRAEDQPDERKEALRSRCFKAVSGWVGPDDAARERYLDGTSRKILRTDFPHLDERGLQKLCGIVERSAARKHAKENANPF